MFSARSGALGVLGGGDAARVRSLFSGEQRIDVMGDTVLASLVSASLVVADTLDEEIAVRAERALRYVAGLRHLVLLARTGSVGRCDAVDVAGPSEVMSEAVQEAALRLVQLGDGDIAVSWAGHEPLAHTAVVLPLTQRLQQVCRARGAMLHLHLPAHGDLLTPEAMAALATMDDCTVEVPTRVTGADCACVAAPGRPAWGRLLSALARHRDSDSKVKITMRCSVSRSTSEHVAEFVDEVAAVAAADPRFCVEFFDDEPPATTSDTPGVGGHMTDVSSSVLHAARRLAAEAGMRHSRELQQLQVTGLACFASDPRSVVVDVDGTLYKCVDELGGHERNRVGRLSADGSLRLDWTKIALWTETPGGMVSGKCVPCAVRPLCHGAACPRDWLDGSECGCPAVLRDAREVLPLVVDARLEPAAALLGGTCRRPPSSRLVAPESRS